ncbi:MAG: helix-turn-helix domain-containing protein [Pseudomonadota bacterium]
MSQRSGEFCELYRARVTMASLDVMAEAFNISLGRLTMTSRQKANVAFARQIAMYLSHVVGQLSLRDIALEFDREPSTVLHACQAVEDQRDKPVFDKQMTVLEEALHERVELIRRDLRAMSAAQDIRGDAQRKSDRASTPDTVAGAKKGPTETKSAITHALHRRVVLV